MPLPASKRAVKRTHTNHSNAPRNSKLLRETRRALNRPGRTRTGGWRRGCPLRTTARAASAAPSPDSPRRAPTRTRAVTSGCAPRCTFCTCVVTSKQRMQYGYITVRRCWRRPALPRQLSSGLNSYCAALVYGGLHGGIRDNIYGKTAENCLERAPCAAGARSRPPRPRRAAGAAGAPWPCGGWWSRPRVRSQCRLAPPFTHFIPDFLPRFPTSARCSGSKTTVRPKPASTSSAWAHSQKWPVNCCVAFVWASIAGQLPTLYSRVHLTVRNNFIRPSCYGSRRRGVLDTL